MANKYLRSKILTANQSLAMYFYSTGNSTEKIALIMGTNKQIVSAYIVDAQKKLEEERKGLSDE